MIINEMLGSGGDYLPYMFRARKLGTMVGKRTWGGLVHTAETPTFVDGGSMIAPRGGHFAADGHWPWRTRVWRRTWTWRTGRRTWPRDAMRSSNAPSRKV